MPTEESLPPLLRGVSASTWQLCSTIASWIAVPPILLAFAAQNLHWRRGLSTDGFVGFFVAFALIALFSMLAWWRSRREVRAGYTTMWRSNPTVLQLDSATGEWIRGPGQAYVSRREWRSHHDDVSATNTVPVARPTFLQRMLPALPMFLLMLALVIAGVAFGSLSHGVPAVIGLSIAAGLVALIVIGHWIGALIASARLKRMRAVVPDDFLFLFSSTTEYRAESAAMGWRGGDSGGMAVSANSSGLTFWMTNPAESTGTLPWKQVVSIQTDRVTSGNTWRPSVLVSFKDKADDIRALQLKNADADLVPFRSMPEVRWIASQLNELRSGTSSARLL